MESYFACSLIHKCFLDAFDGGNFGSLSREVLEMDDRDKGARTLLTAFPLFCFLTSRDDTYLDAF